MGSSSEPLLLSAPEIGGNEWRYVKECLDTGWVSSVGSYVNRFEEAVALASGRAHAVACVNGTSALHAALLVAGVEPDDEVLVSTLTFIAPANAIRYAGAWPVFVDAEPDHWQIDPRAAREFLETRCCDRDGATVNRRTGRRVKAIVPVHILGHPCDIGPFADLAREFGLALIEDATEALGAEYRGKPVGGAGDAACFSFNGNKILTTGGGGMIVTDDASLAAAARHLTTQAKADPVEYIHDRVGFNYRLTNIQAAMGCAQMERLREFVLRKQEVAARYAANLADIPGIAPMREASWAYSTSWLFTAEIDPDRFGMGSRELLAFLAGHKIQSRPLWQPIHLSPAHPGCERVGGEVAERLYARCLSLPCSAGIADADVDRVCGLIRSATRRG
jgi:perosamine synthetase